MTKMLNLEKQNMNYTNNITNNTTINFNENSFANEEGNENHLISSEFQQINEHQKYINDIKSYVNSFNSNIQEKRDFSVSFFNRNKTNHKVYQALIQIYENIDEDYDSRLQTMTILKKIFNKKDFESYIKVKKTVTDEYGIFSETNGTNGFNNSSNLMLNEDSKITDDYLKLMLPRGNNEDLTLEEENQLFSHFGRISEKEDKNHVKVSIIDSLSYIDQENLNQKFQENCKKLISQEMKNLPSINSYVKIVNKHFDKYLDFSMISKNFDEKNEIINDYENTFNFLEEITRKNKESQKKENFYLFSFKDKIQTRFEDPLPIKLNDEENWRKIITNANISLQNFNIYNFNLDLFTKYSPLVWKKYTDNFDKFLNSLQKEKEELNENTEQINRERKFAQVNAQDHLAELENKLKYHLSNNFEINKESLKIKFKISRLLKYKRRRINKKKNQPKK